MLKSVNKLEQVNLGIYLGSGFINMDTPYCERQSINNVNCQSAILADEGLQATDVTIQFTPDTIRVIHKGQYDLNCSTVHYYISVL